MPIRRRAGRLTMTVDLNAPAGLLLIDKPAGWSSFDAVNLVRRRLAQAAGLAPNQLKVGHCGTLDPLATGLLVILVGKDYTRQAISFSQLAKTYRFTLILGQTSTTGDDEGVKFRVSARRPSPAQLEQVLVEFSGVIEQTPPVYSAIKVNGQRAYKLARSGRPPKLKPRAVNIYQLTLIKYHYPLVELEARVSSGTYIRSLAEDIGRKLGVGAYLTQLKRTAVGSFALKSAVAPDRATAEQLFSLPNR